MPQFFISTKDVNEDIITVSDKENFRHIAKVLRAKVGETLLFVDENQTQYKAEIKNISSSTITTKVVEIAKSNHKLNTELYLAQSVLKTDAQNLVVQKATELGIKGIIPYVSDNSVIKSSVADAKIDKWQKIANEAVKQCERVDFLKISERSTLKKIIEDKSYYIKIACVERCQQLTLKSCLKNIDMSQNPKIIVIIGPEGGFSAAELELLNNSDDVYKVSLGNLILRAETAVISALSNVIYELEQDD